MATSQTETDDETHNDSKIYEISVEQLTTETVTVQANSRKEAFEALKEPQDREVQTVLVRKPFSSLMERRPTDVRHAPELEDTDDPDVDIDLTGE